MMRSNGFLIVAGSVRALRRSPAIAEWVGGIGRELCDAGFRVIDLRGLQLGFDDEPGVPAKGTYHCATTQAWSQLVEAAKGVIIVTPQYNWGYPAALKNAIDHLHREWRDKPVLVVTYGARGGDKCAAQLREVLTGLGVRLTSSTPGLSLARTRIEADDGDVDPEQDFKGQRSAVEGGILELVALSAEPERQAG